jgi:hypothetical protein
MYPGVKSVVWRSDATTQVGVDGFPGVSVDLKTTFKNMVEYSNLPLRGKRSEVAPTDSLIGCFEMINLSTKVADPTGRGHPNGSNRSIPIPLHENDVCTKSLENWLAPLMVTDQENSCSYSYLFQGMSVHRIRAATTFRVWIHFGGWGGIYPCRVVSKIFLLGGPRAKPESLRRAPKVRSRGRGSAWGPRKFWKARCLEAFSRHLRSWKTYLQNAHFG